MMSCSPAWLGLLALLKESTEVRAAVRDENDLTRTLTAESLKG